MNPKIQEVTEILRKEGMSEEEIQKILEDITKAATVKLQSEMIANLTEEDLAAIDKCSSQEEANYEIRTRFYNRSGKNADSIMQEFLATFAQGFLDKYTLDKSREHSGK